MTDIEAVAGKIVEELGVTLSTLTMAVGLRTGLWAALAGAGPLTPEQLAQRTGVAPALAREWCRTQAAGGYLRLAGDGFALPDEVAAALVHGPMGELVDAATTMLAATAVRFDAFVRAFGDGRGFGWDERVDAHARGVDRFSRAAIAPDFFARAIGACPSGVAAALRAGGAVLDVGCGYGAPSLMIAEAYPEARVTGCDFHDASIVAARKAAAEAGLADRVRFEVPTAKQAPRDATGYALVVFCDSLHDLGDPVGALARVRQLLRHDGVVLLVEPRGADTVSENLNPVGRMFYAVSTMFCTPTALAQEGTALGTLAGPAALADVAVADLDAALDAATTAEEQDRAAAERAALVKELTAAAGLGGRTRRLGDETERARKTITTWPERPPTRRRPSTAPRRAGCVVDSTPGVPCSAG